MHEQTSTTEVGRGSVPAPARAGAGGGLSMIDGAGAVAERISAICGRCTALASVGLSIGFVACLMLQIVARYVFSDPLSWTEEAAVFLFVWTMLLLASLGVRERFHVSLTFLPALLPGPAWRAGLDALLTAGIGVFGAVMAVTGWQLVDLVWGNTSAAVQYPLQALYLAAPVSGVLTVVHAAAILLNLCREWGCRGRAGR